MGCKKINNIVDSKWNFNLKSIADIHLKKVIAEYLHTTELIIYS
jgi:hypothetical protein